MFRNTTLPFSRIIHSLDPSNTGKLNIFQNYFMTMQLLDYIKMSKWGKFASSNKTDPI